MYISGRRRHTAAEADLLRQEAMEWQTMQLIDDIDSHCLMKNVKKLQFIHKLTASDTSKTNCKNHKKVS